MAGFFDVQFGLQGQFQIAGAEVADGRHIAGEACFLGGGGGGVFDVNDQFAGLGMHFYAGEILEPPEGEVEFQGFHLHIIAQFQDRGFEGVEAVGEFRVRLRQIIGDGFGYHRLWHQIADGPHGVIATTIGRR